MLIDRGYEVFTIAPKDEYTHLLLKEGIHHIEIKTHNKWLSIFNDIRLFFQLLRVYKKYSFDHIFHYTVKPNIFGSLAAYFINTNSTPIVSGAGYTFLSKNWIYYATAHLYKIAVHCTGSIWFVNHDDQREFIDLNICSLDNSEVLPGEGIDTSRFRPMHSQKTKERPFRFLYSGRLIWDKGVHEFIEAARIVKKLKPEVQFHILGFIDVENPHTVSSEEIFQWQSEGLIRYLGKTKNVKPYLEHSDCFVLPSYYREGVPRSLLEAASMAKPIITTNNIGCKEVVQHGVNGFLCRKKDAEDLANKMLLMMDLPEKQRIDMGRKGRELVKTKYAEHLLYPFYLDVLNHKINKNEGSSHSKKMNSRV